MNIALQITSEYGQLWLILIAKLLLDDPFLRRGVKVIKEWTALNAFPSFNDIQSY